MLLLRGTPGNKSHTHVHRRQPVSSCCDDMPQKCSSGSAKEHGRNVHNHHRDEGHECCGKDDRRDLESHSQHKHGGSCGTKKCSSSTKVHGHNVHSHPCIGDRIKDRECGDEVDHHDLGCGTKKCSGSTKEHGHNARGSSCKGERNKDRECCDKVDHHDLESGTKTCSSSTKDHGHNARSHSCDGHRIKNQEPISKGDIVDHHDLESQNQNNHHGVSCGTKKCSSSTKEHGHNAHTHAHHHPEPHSHGSSCGAEKCSSFVKDHAHNTCYGEDIKHDHEHKHGCSNTGHGNQETNKCHQHNCLGEEQDRGHCKEGGHGVGDVGCESSATGCNGGSKKVHRGCCDSFRRECCIRNGHFEANMRGGLSEIVID